MALKLPYNQALEFVKKQIRGLKRKDVFSHMREVEAAFAIDDIADDRCRKQLSWNGRELAITQSLAALHNSKDGDCFIVGTGPSIKDLDLSVLRDKYSIGVNGAILKFIEAGISPSSYTVTTSNFFETRQTLLRKILSSGAECFFPFWGLSHLSRDMPDLVEKAKLVLTNPATHPYRKPKLSKMQIRKWAAAEPLITMHPKNDKYKIGFSRDLELGFFDCDNIIYTALQVAYYLGFRRIFILGMDLNYSGDQPRFYETKSSAAPCWIDKTFERSIIPSFEVIKNLRESGELEVFNLSANSRLPESLVPKISLDEALSLNEKASSQVPLQSSRPAC